MVNLICKEKHLNVHEFGHDFIKDPIYASESSKYVPPGQREHDYGKDSGILINGHEDVAIKTAMDIFIYFQQMGFIFAPYGFTYGTMGQKIKQKQITNFSRIMKN